MFSKGFSCGYYRAKHHRHGLNGVTHARRLRFEFFFGFLKSKTCTRHFQNVRNRRKHQFLEAFIFHPQERGYPLHHIHTHAMMKNVAPVHCSVFLRVLARFLSAKQAYFLKNSKIDRKEKKLLRRGKNFEHGFERKPPRRFD